MEWVLDGPIGNLRVHAIFYATSKWHDGERLNSLIKI